MEYHKIVRRPVVTEKSTKMMQDANQYVFEVSRHATKIEIARAVEELFNVKVSRVRTFNLIGKQRRMGIFTGRRPAWKKAVVTLREGETIPVIEGI
ncbi:MAG: 50S ribosomal protein L23 [Candidatus Glassbacteria bacterium]